MFKEIEGYENYSINEDGLVMNSRGNILKPQVNHKGYLKIGLSKDKKVVLKSIHRLVAEAFIPNHNNYPQVDHIDNNKTNNNVKNLRWINQSGNSRNRNINGKYLKGVSKRGNRFQARIRIDKNIHLGTFDTEEQAHQAYLTKYNELMEVF